MNRKELEKRLQEFENHAVKMGISLEDYPEKELKNYFNNFLKKNLPSFIANDTKPKKKSPKAGDELPPNDEILKQMKQYGSNRN